MTADKRDFQEQSQMLIYQSEDGHTKIEVQLESESVWLSQKQMAGLFQTTVSNINLHLKNIFEEGEFGILPYISLRWGYAVGDNYGRSH